MPTLLEVFFIVRGEESRRTVMLNGEISITCSTKGDVKDQTLEESPTKGNHKEDCSFRKKIYGHTKEMCFKLHGRNKILKLSNKGISQNWADNTTSEQEETNQPNLILN